MTTTPDRPESQIQRPAEPLEGGSAGPATLGRTRKPRAPYVPIQYTCSGCTTTWTGVNRAHCSGCHRTWSGPSMFDQHRRLIRGNGICVDPATIKGQVLRDGIWRSDKERTPDSYGGTT
jgi:hypothetical protein